MKYRGTISITFEALKKMLNLDDSIEIISIGSTSEEARRDICHIHLSSKEPTQLTLPCLEGAKFCELMTITEHNAN